MTEKKQPQAGDQVWVEMQGIAVNVEIIGVEAFTRGSRPAVLCIRSTNGELVLWPHDRYETYEECVQARVARLLDQALRFQREAMESAELIRRQERSRQKEQSP